ncbi:FAD-dependent oxidoreductase [Barrientosiimonas endolithica]|uniref:FAD-dependent oxidoreductase n=1 Tax=Barrientosiimonas endolithica TaxID=1535208 RepID=UPI00259BC02D|nr:NAD(P)-binding protein [Barrientosiimonas endolithica]
MTGPDAPRRRVAIVGGGIAGLALAAGLDPAQFEVVVHEAEPDRKALGAPLGLWPSARAALGRIGAEPTTYAPAPAGSTRSPGARSARSPGPDCSPCRDRTCWPGSTRRCRRTCVGSSRRWPTPARSTPTW